VYIWRFSHSAEGFLPGNGFYFYVFILIQFLRLGRVQFTGKEKVYTVGHYRGIGAEYAKFFYFIGVETSLFPQFSDSRLLGAFAFFQNSARKLQTQLPGAVPPLPYHNKLSAPGGFKHWNYNGPIRCVQNTVFF
jgi:hypothetical protein